MKHTILKTLCIVSGVYSLALAARLIGNIILIYSRASQGMGIIGGADSPMLALLLNRSGTFWLLGSLAVFIVTLILLRKKK
jgi:hypothetical protein